MQAGLETGRVLIVGGDSKVPGEMRRVMPNEHGGYCDVVSEHGLADRARSEAVGAYIVDAEFTRDALGVVRTIRSVKPEAFVVTATMSRNPYEVRGLFMAGVRDVVFHTHIPDINRIEKGLQDIVALVNSKR